MTYPEFTTQELESEEWRPVVGYEGVYSVSNLGRVRRDLGLAGCRAGRILTPAKDSYGYARTSLSKGGTHRARTFHSLVAEAFIGPRPEGLTINHLDGDKANNRASNLEYCTSQENSRHGAALGLMHSGAEHAALCRAIAPRGERNHKAKMTAEQVREMRDKYATGNYTQRQLAAEYGLHRSTTQQILSGRYWSHL